MITKEFLSGEVEALEKEMIRGQERLIRLDTMIFILKELIVKIEKEESNESADQTPETRI
jgi:hypothetical protein